MARKRVSIVIPNWNLKSDCIACVDSVLKFNFPKKFLEIIVVDNGSTDGSVLAIKERFGSVRVLELAKNWGYAGGINKGVKEAKG